MLSLALLVLPSLPGVPYNVAELFGGGMARLGVALALGLWLWTLSLGVWLTLEALVARPPLRVLAPLGVVLHGVVGFWVLYPVVPGESLDDVLGSPVLGWPAPLEHWLRFVALDGWLVFAALVAAALAATFLLRRPRALGVVLMLLIHALWLCPLLYWAIVSQAATDNLTELLRGAASFPSWLALFGAMIAIWLAGAAVASAVRGAGRRGAALAMTILAVGAAAGLAHLALEPMILKYGKVFSVWQFLLSADRAHYLDGGALAGRAVGVLLALVVGLALMLAPVLGRADGRGPRVAARPASREGRIITG